mmetsp:Transcript_7544/g.31130  ORF Transcript_7544/g.31130 Transcript_7544/m.31130 type:complete len:485 (+) Transcript_7544:62-1516(+)
MLKPRLGRISRLALAHVNTRAHHLVHEQELRGDDGRRVQDLRLHDEVVVHTRRGGIKRVAGGDVQAHAVALRHLVLQRDAHVLGVVPAVLGEGLGHDHDGLGERLHAALCPPLHRLLHLLQEMDVESRLKRAGSGDDSLVGEDVLDAAKAVSDCILELRDGVIVGSLEQDGAALGVGHLLDKGVLLLAEHVFVHLTRVAENLRFEILGGVDAHAAARQHQALHISLLGATEADDPLLREHVQRDGIDALLGYHHESLVGAVANLLLEINHLLHHLVGVRALRGDHTLTLLRVAVHEAGVDLGLFVLERDIARQDEGILHVLGHVRVPAAVVHHQTPHQLGVRVQLVPHVHDLHHVKIDGLVRFRDGQDRVHHDGRELIGEFLAELRAKRSLRHADEQLAVGSLRATGGLLPLVEKLDGGLLGSLEPLDDHPRVEALVEIPLRLLEQLADDEHGGGGAVAGDVVLGDSRARDHHRRGVLDLHLLQ